MAARYVFDLFNTLLHGGDDARDRVVERMAGIVGVDPVALRRAYHETWRARMTRWDTEETVRILAGRLGADPSGAQVRAAAELRREFAAGILATVPQSTLDTLDALRAAGVRLALVSNATADSAEAWPGSPLAARFDVALFSAQAGIAKPDPRIYRLAADGLGTPPAGCVYVGDGADRELAGAVAVGMTVLRTTEFNDTDPAWPGPAIASLADLLRAAGPVPPDPAR
ncbi:MAG TPA: HAD family hydrolase, partial [Rugosimonospora sp.]|nr:HAD family hydrolase [Rugosimonospora sp.]